MISLCWHSGPFSTLFHSKSPMTFLEAVRELIVPPNCFEKLSLASSSVGASEWVSEQTERSRVGECSELLMKRRRLQWLWQRLISHFYTDMEKWHIDCCFWLIPPLHKNKVTLANCCYETLERITQGHILFSVGNKDTCWPCKECLHIVELHVHLKLCGTPSNFASKF